MADVEPRIVAKLKGTNAVTALVSTRVYPMRMAASVALPAVTYQRISTTPQNHATGTLTGQTARVQIDCWAASYAGAKGVAGAVRDALSGWSDNSGTPVVIMSHLIDEQDDAEPVEEGTDTTVFRVSQDYEIDFGS